MVCSPRGPSSPPSPISLSALKLVADEEKLELTVQGLDLLDGTPVLDVKPYVPYCDAFPDARAGMVDRLDDEPDRRRDRPDDDDDNVRMWLQVCLDPRTSL